MLRSIDFFDLDGGYFSETPVSIVVIATAIALAVYVYFYVRGKPLDAGDMPVVVGVCLALAALLRWAITGHKKGGKPV